MKRNLHAGGARSRGLSVNVFTESELDDIHLASLEILERTGVWVEADDALDIFNDGGCVGSDRGHARRQYPAIRGGGVAPLVPAQAGMSSTDATRSTTSSSNRTALAFTNFSEGILVIDAQHRRVPAIHAAGYRRDARLVDDLSDFDTYEIAVRARRRATRETAAVLTVGCSLPTPTKPIGIGPLRARSAEASSSGWPTSHLGWRGRSARTADRCTAASAR